MKNPPAIQFYVRDWLADSHVRRMTYEERGIYLELLCYCWEDDGLPSSVDELAKLCHVPVKRFDKIWLRLQRQFVQVERDGETVLYNPRLLNGNGAKDKPKPDTTEASERARKAANARWSREESDANAESMQDAYAEPMRDASNGHAQSMQDASKNDAQIYACGGVPRARYTANADADADADADAECGVPEKGSGEKPHASDAKPDATGLVESEASALASRFLEIRQAALDFKAGSGERRDATGMFAELLEVNSATKIRLVLKMLGSSKGRKHWQYGLGNRINANAKKPHPLVNTFGSLLAATDEFMPSGKSVDPERERPADPVDVPPILPADMEPFPEDFWATVIEQIEPDAEEREAWLRPASLLGRSGSELWLRVPSKLHAEWIRKNYADALANATGYDIRVAVIPDA